MTPKQTAVNHQCQSGLAREIRELATNLHTHATNNAMRTAMDKLERGHVHETIARAEIITHRSRELLALMGEEVPG